jgi:hypothetical protein
VIPNPDFEDFSRDCVRLVGQEKSRELRSDCSSWQESGCKVSPRQPRPEKNIGRIS